jgi:hypothetical protein
MLTILRCRIFGFQFTIQEYEIYRTIILPVVLYGCEISSLTLREERRLGVFENRVLRKVSGSKINKVTAVLILTFVSPCVIFT